MDKNYSDGGWKEAIKAIYVRIVVKANPVYMSVCV